MQSFSLPGVVLAPPARFPQAIITRLKGTGRLVRNDTLLHSVPFCWRSHTPLIYKAVRAAGMPPTKLWVS